MPSATPPSELNEKEMSWTHRLGHADLQSETDETVTVTATPTKSPTPPAVLLTKEYTKDYISPKIEKRDEIEEIISNGDQPVKDQNSQSSHNGQMSVEIAKINSIDTLDSPFFCPSSPSYNMNSTDDSPYSVCST